MYIIVKRITTIPHVFFSVFFFHSGCFCFTLDYSLLQLMNTSDVCTLLTKDSHKLVQFQEAKRPLYRKQYFKGKESRFPIFCCQWMQIRLRRNNNTIRKGRRLDWVQYFNILVVVLCVSSSFLLLLTPTTAECFRTFSCEWPSDPPRRTPVWRSTSFWTCPERPESIHPSTLSTVAPEVQLSVNLDDPN